MHALLPLCLLLMEPPTAPTHYLSTREIILSIPPQDFPPAALRAWMTEDGGATWSCVDSNRAGGLSLSIRAPRDGAFGFFISHLDDGVGDVPLPGRAPQVTVVVDTLAPTLQIQRAQSIDSAAGCMVAIELVLIEENLGPRGVQLFVRSTGAGDAAPWQPAGELARQDAKWVCVVPPSMCRDVDLCVVATDRAGNRGRDERRGVNLESTATPPNPGKLNLRAMAGGAGGTSLARSPDGKSEPTSPPASNLSAQGAADFARKRSEPSAQDVGQHESTARGLLPTDLVRTEPSPPSRSDDHAALGASDRTQRLLNTARRFLDRGDASLARARLDDALQTAPGDVEVLALRARANLRTSSLAAAESDLRQALDRSPRHIGALDGLAALAGLSGNVDEARSTLEKLTALKPAESRHWLDYGDVLFKLDRTADARVAWSTARDRATSADRMRQRADERLSRFPP